MSTASAANPPEVDVIIVGAGLAGLTVALDCVQRGLSVTVLEASGQAGGKAGSDPDGAGRLRDYGLHILPGWYQNVRALLAHTQQSDKLVDHDRVAYLRRGESLHGKRVLRSPRGPRDLLLNLTRGPLAWYDAVAYHYFVLDLVSRPVRRRRIIDRLSLMDFLYARWYRTEGVARYLEHNGVHAASIPASELSLGSWQQVMKYWLRSLAPLFSVVDGDLQSVLIEPLVASLRAQGVQFLHHHRVSELVSEAGRVAGVRVERQDGASQLHRARAHVVCTPLEVTRRLVSDDIFTVDPSLGAIHCLRSEPMSGFYLELDGELDGLGRDFLFLEDSAYGLAVMNLTPGTRTTTLSVVVGDFAPLRGLSREHASRVLLDELAAYLGFDAAQVRSTYLHDNVSTPLFVNTASSWANRPGARTRLGGLFLAGDWCQNAVDLATMEGAVSAGHLAASALLADFGIDAPPPAPPPEWSPTLLRAAVNATLPAVVLPVVVARVMELAARWRRRRAPA